MGKRQLQCRRPDIDPDIFFSQSQRKIDRAKQLCAMCPAQHACLLASFAVPGELGIWGGMTKDERSELIARVRQRRTLGADPEPADQVGPAEPDGDDASGNTDTGTDAEDDTPAEPSGSPDQPGSTPDGDSERRSLAGAAA